MKILLCSWNCTSRLQNDRKDHKTLTLQIYSRTCTHGFWGQNNLHITTSFIPKNSLMHYSKGKKKKNSFVPHTLSDTPASADCKNFCFDT